MIIGVPKEVKNNECRVGLTPNSVKCLVDSGHKIIFQKNAGAGIGYFDDQYLGHNFYLMLKAVLKVFTCS